MEKYVLCFWTQQKWSALGGEWMCFVNVSCVDLFKVLIVLAKREQD